MFIKLFAVLAVLIETLLCLFCNILDGWKDFWIPIVMALGLFVGIIVLYVLFLVVVSLFLNKNKPCDRPSMFCKFFVDHTVDSALKFLRVKVELKGIEKIPTDRRFLLVSNHRSGLDPFVCISQLMEYNVAFVSKPENFKLPIVGRFVSRCCYMTIDRENARNAMKTLHKATDYVKNDTVSVGIYPEGTRSKSGELLEFKDGVFYVAKKAPCPVVVITVQNTENILKNFPFKGTRVKLDVLSVLYPEDFETKSTHEISDEVRQMMYENLGK